MDNLNLSLTTPLIEQITTNTNTYAAQGIAKRKRGGRQAGLLEPDAESGQDQRGLTNARNAREGHANPLLYWWLQPQCRGVGIAD